MGPVGRRRPPGFTGTMVCPGLGSHAVPPVMSLPGKETPWVAGLPPAFVFTVALCKTMLIRGVLQAAWSSAGRGEVKETAQQRLRCLKPFPPKRPEGLYPH